MFRVSSLGMTALSNSTLTKILTRLPPVFSRRFAAALTGDHLRKYPEPSGHTFRGVAGRVLVVDPDSILIGNGSDDILTIANSRLSCRKAA